ncbi:MAG: hypothetical protein A3D94_04625 [Alphaproteobacteria bacterium RIFCSPHIGHO2_12_FULL_66_14]|jgi:hypothetical protein|nr:MAG: hypothetical protein A3D94_04625 [Alphaproteobacteria bacterium RIFCSPHIGHO2_12_FULL_66_14]
MIDGRHTILASAAVVLALALGGCGGSSSPSQSMACPPPLTVQDAGRITHFKAGPGRDPRDVAYEAALVNSSTSCQLGRNVLDVTLVMIVAAAAGPSASGGQSRIPYFVRVIDGSGRVVQGQDFTADFKLSAANPRGESREELSLTIPFGQLSDLGGYRIAVGLKPTPEELNYNRRAAGR